MWDTKGESTKLGLLQLELIGHRPPILVMRRTPQDKIDGLKVLSALRGKSRATARV